jgi:hypothetical protein
MSDDVDRYIRQLNEEKARSEAEKKALIEEFSKSIPTEWSPEDLKEKMRDLLGKSYARISQTIDDDDEKALAFQAAKYVMGIGIGATKITGDNDPNKEFKELLAGLAPKTQETAPVRNAKDTTES